MSLIWHIAKKDIRRMAWPTVAWLAFIVATAGWFAHGASLGSITTKWEAEAWVVTVRWFTLIATIIKELLGYLLIGALILEDPLNGTTAFWQTRPLSNGRLLLAKVIGVIGLFVVIPALVLVPIWLAFGFDRETAFLGVLASIWPHSLLALVALAIASLSANLRRFLFLSVALIGAYALCGAWYTTHLIATDSSLEVRWSRDTIVLFGIIPAGAAIVASQYLNRNIARSWWLVAVALVACLAVRIIWPWNIMSWLRPETTQQTPVVSAYAEKYDRSTSLTLQLNLPSRSDGVLVPYLRAVYLQTAAGEIWVARQGSPRLRDDIAERLALGENAEATRWRISAFDPNRRWFESESVRGRIICDIVLADLRRYPPMAIVAGVASSTDSSQVRVESVATLPDRSRVLILCERDAVSSWFYWHPRPFTDPAFQSDEYVTVDRGQRRAETCGVHYIESTGFAGMAIGYREVVIYRAVDPTAVTRDVVLTKLRFVRRPQSPIATTVLSVPFEATEGISLETLEKGEHP